jgi:peptidoglycan LD-endopeptidase LytH
VKHRSVIGVVLGAVVVFFASSCSADRGERSIPTATPVSTIAASTAAAPTVSSPSTVPPSTTRPKNPNPAHAYPIAADVNSSYGRTHGGYPATDVFANCGSTVRAMADGEVIEARTKNLYDPVLDNPALRGGPSVAILGDDNVRYYTSHLGEVFVEVGAVVDAGDPIGTIALTGDSEACHTHVGLSTTCPGPEWSVRRGAIWPWPYLDAWRKGDSTKSPAPELLAWLAANPQACTTAMADPYAAAASE